MDGKGIQNVPWTACWKESEQQVQKGFYLGCSLRRTDLSSLISRSAQDLPKLKMSFPTGRDRLLDKHDAKEQE
jgi:hypothetical protein